MKFVQDIQDVCEGRREVWVLDYQIQSLTKSKRLNTIERESIIGYVKGDCSYGRY